MNLFLRFFFTGAAGALLSLAITWGLTTFVFGTARYFDAYLIGIAANLLFNFVMYTIAVFKTKRDHIRRLAVFLFYGLIMAALQGTTVKLITAHLGTAYYLPIIAATIALFAVLNFFVFKLSIFREYEEGARAPARAVLAFIIVCAVLLRLAVLFHVLADAGVSPLVYGDAFTYRELATHLIQGDGFVSYKYGALSPEVFRMPGLPLLLAPFASTDSGLAFYFFLLAIVGGILLPYFTYRLSIRFVSSAAALVAAALAAFEPHLVFFSTLPQSEVPFMLFSYAGLLAAFHAYEQRSYLYAAFAGTLLGYAVYIRPGFFPVLVASLLIYLGYLAFYRRALLAQAATVLLAVLVVLAPWYVRTHEVTGVYALSGAGWRNVYTDYLASVRAIEHHTDFSSEKTNLKQQAELAGVDTEDVDSPASASKLRAFALKELWQKKLTVAKLESTLLVSFFLQDGYYYEFRRFLLVPDDSGAVHTSATFALLNKGIAGVPDVVAELGRQLFIPLFGRLFTFGLLLAALAGFFVVPGRLKYLFAFIIALSALTATAIGLGVESRLRLPVEPLLFFFAAAALVKLPFLRIRHED